MVTKIGDYTPEQEKKFMKLWLSEPHTIPYTMDDFEDKSFGFYLEGWKQAKEIEKNDDLWELFRLEAEAILGAEGPNEDTNKLFELWMAGYNRGEMAQDEKNKARIKELERISEDDRSAAIHFQRSLERMEVTLERKCKALHSAEACIADGLLGGKGVSKEYGQSVIAEIREALK